MIAGVNSFGFGGANAHVILAEAPSRAHDGNLALAANRPWPVVLSARSEGALRNSALRLSEWLDAKEKSNGLSPVLPDLTYTLGARRNHHQHRLTIVGRSPAEIVGELSRYASEEAAPKVRTAFTPRREQAIRVAFVFSGQGPQWWGMGRELFEHEPVFQRIVTACDTTMRQSGVPVVR